MNGYEHFASERKRLETQMLEARSELGSVGQRQQELRSADGHDSVEAQNVAAALQTEREAALREINRINEDLRKLALAEEARAKQDREAARQAERDQALKKEDLEREEREKETRLKEAIQEKDERLRGAIDQRDAIDQKDRERTAAPATPEPPTLGNANNPAADTLSAGTVAIVKGVDVWLENSQLLKHLLERQHLDEQHRQEQVLLNQQIANWNLQAQQAAQAALAAQQQQECENLARRQAELERKRNERADRDGLSI